MNYRDLRILRPDTEQFEEVDRELKRQYADMANTLVDTSCHPSLLGSPVTKLSAANVRMTRLLHYYIFTDDLAVLPNFAALEVKTLSEPQRERAILLHRHALSLISDETGEERHLVETQLKKAFPGLTISQLGYLCGCAGNYRRARILKDKIRRAQSGSLADFAEYFTFSHGRGYAATEAGRFNDLGVYLDDVDGVKTELAHLQLLERIIGATDKIKIAANIHPVAFAKALEDFSTLFKDVQNELNATQDHWQISKVRRLITGAADDLLAMSFLRIASNGTLTWREIAIRAHDSTMTEDKARGLFGDLKNEPWYTTLFQMAERPESSQGFQSFASPDWDFQDLIDDVLDIEGMIYAES